MYHLFPSQAIAKLVQEMLLERLGNRKSAVLVAALYEYLQTHPALQNPECKIELRATHSYPPEAIVQLVREMVGEQLEQIGSRMPQKSQLLVQDNQEVAEMLENLEMFT